MAMAEDGGSPSDNAASSYGGGGAGGKFRRKPFRKQPTPYDRPPTALRGTNKGGSTSWMRKLFVDPASKLISYGANRFFSSFFHKRLPPPPLPQPPEVHSEVNEEVQAAVLVQESAQEAAGGESSVPTDPRSNEICELERLLKQRTFSRSEITHLTKLLQSKALEGPSGDNGRKNEVTAFDVKRHEQFASSQLEENRKEGILSYADMSTPLNSKVLEDDIATPAELAKAFMGGKPSKGSSSLLGVRHQENGITPRSQGKSAIYNMARTPYSRVLPSSIVKGRSNIGVNNGPSMSSSILSSLVTEEKLPMTLKHRSSALDDEIESTGSIRRTRQKSNLLASRNPEITHGVSIGSHTKQKLQLIGGPSHNVLQAVGETESVPITSHPHVPSKSTEVAARIFQHLEKLTPKEKSSESKLVATLEKSPMKLTSGMLSAQALRNMKDLDSSKLLMIKPHDHKLGDSSVTTLPNTRDGSSQKMRNIEENGLKESVVPSGIWNPVKQNDYAGSLRVTLAANRTTDFVAENGAFQPPPKKRTFRMSAQEDSFDLDDEVNINGIASLVDSRPAPAEVTRLVKTTTPASKEAAVVSQSVFPPFSVATSVKPMESISSPVFSFSSKVADKFPTLSPEYHKRTESAAENSSRLFNVSASTGSHLKIPELDKPGHPSPPKAGDINNKSDIVPQAKWPHVSSFSPAFTGTSDHINQVSTGNGLMFTSTTSISDLAPTGSSTTSTTTSGSIFGLLPKSSVAGPVFKFGHSISSTSSVPATPASEISELVEKKTKVDTNPSPGSSSIPNSSIVAPPAANPGSITFGLGSSVGHSSGNLHGSLFGDASKSLGLSAQILSQDASLPSIPSTSSPGTVSQGTSVLSVSLAPSPLFKMNGKNGGSSFPNARVSTPSNAFSFSSSASLSDTITVAPTSGPTSEFKFGSGPVSEGNPLSSGSASTPGMFSFGFGYSSYSTTGAAGSNSSATLPKSNLGGSSSVPVSSSTTGTSGIFTFSGSSTLSAVNTSSSNTAAANVFGSSWQSSASSIFGSSLITSLSPGFSSGASSTPSAATDTAPMSFNSSAGVMSNPFSFNTASASVSSSQSLPPNQLVFRTPPASAFGSSPVNDEDSMAEDPVQSSAPSAPLFVQPSISPSTPAPRFAFGSTVPSQPNSMFASQQSQATPQDPPSFQAMGSPEFSAGGSLSLGSGGGDKSGRRIVKVSRSKNRKR